MQLSSDSLFFVLIESVVRKLTEEVQEQQRLAEAVGGLHQLQPVLLQVSSGEQHSPVRSSGSSEMCCSPSHRVYPPPGLNSSHLCIESPVSASIQSLTCFPIQFLSHLLPQGVFVCCLLCQSLADALNLNSSSVIFKCQYFFDAAVFLLTSVKGKGLGLSSYLDKHIDVKILYSIRRIRIWN